MDRRLAVGAAVFTCLAATWRRVKATCNEPPSISGTRHNGSLAVYQPGNVLYFSCDTGYQTNYDPPTQVCLDDGNWNPAEISCELDIVSLVIAIVVALVGIIVFVLAILWLRKRRVETDSRRIRKKRASSNKYANYEPRSSTNRNGHVNHGMTEIEMGTMGTPMRGNGSVVSREGTNGHANGLLWNPPPTRGTVNIDDEYAVLQRSRKSSATSRSSRTDNMPMNNASGVHLNPDVGDVEFGAANTNMQNFRDIGSTMNAMAPPTLIANSLEKSLPFPDSVSPRSVDDNDGPAESPQDFDNLYASVDVSKKKNRGNSEKENNNNSNSGVMVEATIESDGYSAIGSSSTFSAHEEALAGDSPYSDIKNGGFDQFDAAVDDADGDYAVVKRVDETPKDVVEENDFDGLYAKVQK